MKKAILNLGKALNKTEQKEVKGGMLNISCYYNCNGTTARLANRSTYCLLNYPAIVYNSPLCGGDDDGPGDIWA